MAVGMILKNDTTSDWTFERIRETYEKVAADEIGGLEIVKEMLRKSTDFLRRIIAPVDGMGGVTLSFVCPRCNCFTLEDYIWWVSSGHGDRSNRKKKHCNWWCAACGPTRMESTKLDTGCRLVPVPLKRTLKRRCSRRMQSRPV